MKHNSLHRHATMLAAAGAVEYALQLALPMILVRHLSAGEFGDYRLVWLLANTAVILFPFFVPQSLFFFLPRSDEAQRAKIIANAWLFIIVAGLTAAVAFVGSWGAMPDSVGSLRKHSGLVPAFIALWTMGSLMDFLPVADGRPRWQAISVVVMALLRTAALAAVAVLAHASGPVILAMCVLAAIKVALLPVYLRSVGSHPPTVDFKLLSIQLRYAAPFALANALYLLRVQADQWIVASLFASDQFALISIAAIVLSVSTLVRQPVNNALLPKFSALIGASDFATAQALLRSAYLTLAFLLVPALGLLLATSRDLIEAIYTRTYIDAAPMMEIYLIGQITGVFAAGHLLVAMAMGRLASVISAVCLGLSIVLSLLGVHLIGLPGAAAGSVVSLFLGEIWALHAVARRLNTTAASLVSPGVSVRLIVASVMAVAATRTAAFTLFYDQPVAWRLLLSTVVFCLILAITGNALRLNAEFRQIYQALLKRRPLLP